MLRLSAVPPTSHFVLRVVKFNQTAAHSPQQRCLYQDDKNNLCVGLMRAVWGVRPSSFITLYFVPRTIIHLKELRDVCQQYTLFFISLPFVCRQGALLKFKRRATASLDWAPVLFTSLDVGRQMSRLLLLEHLECVLATPTKNCF